MTKNKCDFSGYATHYELECSDGLTIKQGCFKHQDGKTVPLVWNHGHNSIHDVIGHCVLENRKDGVYAYTSLNETEGGKTARELVSHGDINAYSIFANKLKCKGRDVLYGDIKEVSLCLAGANPGAFIDNIAIAHSDDGEIEYDQDVEIIIGNSELEIHHSEDNNEEESIVKQDQTKDIVEEENENLEHAENNEGKTIQEVFDAMSPEQQACCQAIVGLAIAQTKEELNVEHSDNMEENNDMSKNIFEKENDSTKVETLSHSELDAAFKTAIKRGGESLRAEMENELNSISHSVTDIDTVYPDHKAVGAPETKDIEQGWASEVMASVHTTPFKKIKSQYIDLTVEGARARGFVKGNEKAEQVVAMGKRTTDPTTVYVKQALHRDDVLDAEGFDIVAYLKGEMDVKLKEEVARAILVGDGRSVDSDDKINPLNIRPILGDNNFYVVAKAIARAAGDTDTKFAKKFISNVRTSKKEYKGKGSPVCFMNEDLISACLEIEDTNGRYIYKDEVELARALRVSRIISTPVLDNVVREGSGTDAGKSFKALAIMVNLGDYYVGGSKNRDNGWFEDFDINLNKQIYLTETRLSGAMTKWHGAVTFEEETAAAAQ